MPRAILIMALLASACAAQRARPAPTPIREYSFSGLRGQRLVVEVVDRGRQFDASPRVITATRQAVEEQLRLHGVVVDAPAPRTLVLELAEGGTEPYSARSCVTVTGRLESTGQAFLPAQAASATRCGGTGPGIGPADPISAIGVVITEAVNAANGSAERELAAALAEALADVLAQVDVRTR